MASFEKVKASVPIERAAKLLGLELHQEKNQLRGRCPACNTGDNRMLAITPSKGVGVFFCRVADTGGSCIDLVAHITGMSLPEAAEWLADTLPQDEEIRSSERGTAAHSPPKAQPAPKPTQNTANLPKQPFDALKFGDSLEYNEHIEALGLSEQVAKLVRVGMKRGKRYFPICPPDVEPIGYLEEDQGKLRLPEKWLQLQNVTRLPKRA